jgi:uncharacterized repeat protein (TIGR03843 family)
MANPLKIIGQMVNASNSTLVVEDEANRYIYKPESGERPLWDFPNGTLHKRERAAFVMSEILAWNLVPKTQLSEGPYGVGSLQNWLEAQVTVVDIFPPGEVPDKWLTVITGLDENGHEVTLAHANEPRLKQIAVFDALINNADRKAGHILTDQDGNLFGIDHGLTFHDEDKLRTVLWGWINEPIPEDLLSDLVAAASKIPSSELTQLLSEAEISALLERLEHLITTKKMPIPSPHWPAVPWPVF